MHALLLLLACAASARAESPLDALRALAPEAEVAVPAAAARPYDEGDGEFHVDPAALHPKLQADLALYLAARAGLATEPLAALRGELLTGWDAGKAKRLSALLAAARRGAAGEKPLQGKLRTLLIMMRKKLPRDENSFTNMRDGLLVYKKEALIEAKPHRAPDSAYAVRDVQNGGAWEGLELPFTDWIIVVWSNRTTIERFDLTRLHLEEDGLHARLALQSTPFPVRDDMPTVWAREQVFVPGKPLIETRELDDDADPKDFRITVKFVKTDKLGSYALPEPALDDAVERLKISPESY